MRCRSSRPVALMHAFLKKKFGDEFKTFADEFVFAGIDVPGVAQKSSSASKPPRVESIESCVPTPPDKDWETKLAKRLCPKKLRVAVVRLPDVPNEVTKKGPTHKKEITAKIKLQNGRNDGDKDGKDPLASAKTSVDSSKGSSKSKQEFGMRKFPFRVSNNKKRQTIVPRKEALREPKKKKTNERPSNLQRLKKKLSHTSASQKHQNKNRCSYTCSSCGKSFSRKIGFLRHKGSHRAQNLLLSNSVRIHRVKRPFNCSFCKKSFRMKRTLSHHQLVYCTKNPNSFASMDYVIKGTNL